MTETAVKIKKTELIKQIKNTLLARAEMASSFRQPHIAEWQRNCRNYFSNLHFLSHLLTTDALSANEAKFTGLQLAAAVTPRIL